MSSKAISTRNMLKEISESRLKLILDKLNAVYPEEKGLSVKNEYLADLPAEKMQQELLKLKAQDPQSQPLVKAICIFHERQAKEQNSYNALTDILTKEALEKAKALDSQVTASTIKNYPLYGYIISVKDCIKIKGQISSCGVNCNLKEQTKDTPFIDYIEKNGAVVLCRGNIPQMLFAMESSNHIYGAVSNPWNIERSAGGSSGGDAALVALGHVNAAIGSDIAGSLRIPAFFCGTYSMNMTSSRIDGSAHAEVFEFLDNIDKLPEKQFSISVTIGPITKTVEDLAKFSEVIVNYYNENPRIPPVAWNKQPAKVTRIGVVVEWDNVFELTETNRRAMKIARDALEASGIQTIDIDMRAYIIKLIKYIATIFLKNKVIIGSMKGDVDFGEPLIEPYENFVKLLQLPPFLVKTLRKVMPDIKKKIYMNALVQSKKRSAAFVMGKIQTLKKRLLDQMREAEIELFLCPGMMPAVIKNSSKDTNLWAAYMFVWNGLNFCSGAMPVTRVTPEEQVYKSKFNYEFEASMRKNMATAEGLPVGVQIVGLPWHEEQIIEVMRLIEPRIAFK